MNSCFAPVWSRIVNAPVVASSLPPAPFGEVGVLGLLKTWPTKAPAGMPVPVTERPTSVAMADRAVISVAPDAAEAVSVLAPWIALPPPSRQVPLGLDGTVWATQEAGRSIKAL